MRPGTDPGDATLSAQKPRRNNRFGLRFRRIADSAWARGGYDLRMIDENAIRAWYAAVKAKR